MTKEDIQRIIDQYGSTSNPDLLWRFT